MREWNRPDGKLSERPSWINTLIVGAGPAGLAVGACLRRANVPCLLLERAEQISPGWRNHYERLHLHTDKARSQLPFHRFPRSTPRYPSRQQVVEYLESYASRFELPIELGQSVEEVRPVQGGWECRLQGGVRRARHLVIATGNTRVPYRPQWPGQEQFAGRLLHSCDYRNGRSFKGQRVLVIGFGNSGGEIAIDLRAYGAHPTVAVRRPVNAIPRDLFGIPILALALLLNPLPARLADALTAPILRFTLGDLRQYGLQPLPYGPMTQIKEDGRIPLLDIGTLDLIRRGEIAIRPGVERFTRSGVIFDDGCEEPFQSVILATGYRAQLAELMPEALETLDERGTPLVSGRESALPGLYFCGFYVAPTGMLREINIEARRIAREIAAKSREPVG